MKLNYYTYPFYLAILILSVNLLCLQANAAGNETDRLALLKFKQSITRDPLGIFNSWNDSLHFCNWFGISCGRRHQRVTSLVLEGHNLFGLISPYIGNLTFLRLINLQNNSLYGEIPQQVGNLFRLQYFILNNNRFGGEIPVDLIRCSQLRVIDLRKNSLVRKIPEEIGSLSKLEKLDIGGNNLTGKIPTSISNLSLLTTFIVIYNNLVGNIPDEIGQLTKLAMFGIATNNISGTIPPSLFNISSMEVFAVAENQLSGSLPENIGLTLLSLQHITIGGNQFSGSIPNSFSNASRLQMFDIAYNNFVGQVPANLGSPKDLWCLNVASNNLGNNSANDLMFLTSLKNYSKLEFLAFSVNNFGGNLSNSVTNLPVHLTSLYVGGNQFTGRIPAALGNLTNLFLLSMRNGFFTGEIPSSFANLQKLQGLALDRNRLSGQIPSFLCNLTQLSAIDFSQNQFEGTIPSSIQDCRNLYTLQLSQNSLSGAIPPEVLGLLSLSTVLNLSQNSFTGQLPTEIGKLVRVNTIDISENNLSGEIPGTIRDCSNLEYLYLQGNSFQGSIPPSLPTGLRVLDLSQNNLTGEIPQSLQNLTLENLNLSFNHFEGRVPTGGIFRKPNSVSLVGNSKLCGGIPEFHFVKCPDKEARKLARSRAFKLKVIIVCVVLPVLLTSLGYLVFAFVKNSKKKPSSATPDMEKLEKVSYAELHRATSGFASENLIGFGGFSSVYHGFLDSKEKRPIAVKVLNLQQKGASKSIETECNVLRNIRHRNLVKIITFCSSLDYKGNEFKALVLEFMANGSLEKWLHPVSDIESQLRYLNLSQRLNIAIDVASALHYLHDLSEIPVIHCDLKPSNVLLDEDLVAHVSDFSIARLLPTTNELSQNKTSTTGIKGTIGYTAPEYGMGCKASKDGDVYSFGILLLEIFSGKRPIDEIFKNGLNLHDFIKEALARQRLVQVIDPTLLPSEMDNAEAAVQEDNGIEIVHENLNPMTEKVQRCLASILEIGVNCSTESPNERMKMENVERKLHLIKNAFLRTEVPRRRRVQAPQ